MDFTHKSIGAVLPIGNLTQIQEENIKFVAVALVGSQYTRCSCYVGLRMKWHFHEKSTEMRLKFRVF